MGNQKILKKRSNYKDSTALPGSFESLNEYTYYGDIQAKVVPPMQFN